MNYTEINEPLEINLSFLRISLWILYVTTELTFYDEIEDHRYWKYKGEGCFAYNPSEEGKAWQKKFLKIK